MNSLPIVTALPATSPRSAAERLAALFDAHHERLYRFARRLVPTADNALDLVQETFLKAARASDSIPSDFAVEEAWLVRVLVNIQRDRWRKSLVRRRHDMETRASSGPASDTEAALVARDAVWTAVDRLSSGLRAILVLHDSVGLSEP